MKAFLSISALLVTTSATPQFFRGSTALGVAPTVGHPTPPHPIPNSPGVLGGVIRTGLGGLGHGVVSTGLGGVGGRGFIGGVGHGVVGGRGFIGGVGHGVVGHAVHAAEVYPDEISPYTYQYNVADDYSGSNFQATESDDGTGIRDGSYSVALPDGRVQHVAYHANDLDGYVAQVTYDGTAAYPELVSGVGGTAAYPELVS